MHSHTPASPATPLLTNVLDKLGREIIAGKLPVGHTFTLQDIGERFGISRTVAREAMRALEQLGLVSSSRRVGITVRPPEDWAVYDATVIAWRLQTESERPKQLRSLVELRLAIEPVAAHYAAIRATDEQREELVSLGETLRELSEQSSATSSDYLQTDMRFLALLLEASGNEMFAAMSSSLLKALYRRAEFGGETEGPATRDPGTHVALAAAVADGDADAAEAAAHAVIADVRASLRARGE